MTGGPVKGAPSPFSKELPKLQLAWDATSLDVLLKCPRRYQYSIIEGFRSSSVDTEFGGYFAEAVEVYKKARLAGSNKEDATIAALNFTIERTWLPATEDHPDGFPWGGSYDEQWRCEGTEPFKNAKGNRAKCPWSHKGAWFPGPAPDVCGTCGSHTHSERRWVSNDNAKDRYTLVRLVAWYADEQPERPEDALHPIQFADGTPAVELSWSLPLPYRASTGEPFILAGHFDSVSAYGSEHFITDNKTTGKTIGPRYFEQFSPNTQMDTYDLAGSLLFPDMNLRGVMVEVAQTLVGGAHFGLGASYRTESYREEWFKEMKYWLDQADKFAQDDYWPMNRANCFLCQFKMVCKVDPGSRQQYLEANFKVRKWNPLEER